MPTSRPASPATLSTTNAVALACTGAWLADASGDIPDLTGVQPNAVLVGSPTYSAAVMGGAITPSTSPSYASSHPTVVSVSAYPVILGAVFRRTGTKTPGSGQEALFALGDSTNNTGGIFAEIIIDDGTAATNGDIISQIRVTGGGNVGLVNGGAYTASTQMAVVASFYVSAGVRKVAIFVDGTKVSDGNPASDPGAFGSDTMNYATLLNLIRAGSQNLQASTSTSIALGWYSQTKLLDSDYTTWSGDPWIILQQPSSVIRGRGRAVL